MTARTRQINVILEPVLVSGAMRRIDRVLRTVADKDVAVCLIGESGSGKEVLARRLHELSSRRAGPFVPINCAAIPEPLIESELFGHERGAFTGAHELAHGKIEAAHGGTLFLDEIGEMPLAMQSKLLRFLESRRFMRLGGSTKVDVDVRLVSATLRPLEQEVAAGRFRADLYYRIQGITLNVPPLRERRADVAPLIEQLVAELTSRHKVPPPVLARSAVSALRRYAWPGNVRELRNVIERLCLLRGGKRVRARDLPHPIPAALKNGHTGTSTTMVEVSLDRTLDETIEEIIRAVVDLEGGNRTRAANRLGIGIRTIQRKLGDNKSTRVENADLTGSNPPSRLPTRSEALDPRSTFSTSGTTLTRP